MKSLKGFVLKQFKTDEKPKMHRVDGTSMKIGSSFVCHLILKELRDVHFDISLNEYNQVEIRNHSQASPISVNGVALQDRMELVPGDTIEVLGNAFIWERQSNPDDAVDVNNANLEASYQIENPTKDARWSEPRVKCHKWLANTKPNQSIHFGKGEASDESSSSDIDSEGEKPLPVIEEEEKENQRPSVDTVPETESDSDEGTHEKTILKELTEHSLSALIDLNTPEQPQKSVNFIDLSTPAPGPSSPARLRRTPARGTPKTAPGTASKLLKKILDPRMSISTLESDFNEQMMSGNVQSTPMVDRSQGSNLQLSGVIGMSDIDESAEISDASTIVSNSVRQRSVAVDSEDLEEIPETQPVESGIIEELFEDAEELAKSDTEIRVSSPTMPENTLQLTVSMDDEEVGENDDEFIPATQAEELPTMGGEEEMRLLEDDEKEEEKMPTIAECVEDSPVIFDETIADVVDVVDEQEKEQQPPEEIIDESPVTTAAAIDSPVKEQNDEEEPTGIKTKSFTPRKSLRTPKKIDLDRCCTPKSLSKVLLTEAAQRRSPRTPRMNFSLRIDGETGKTPVAAKTPKNLSKSLMVSKLQSAKKSAIKAGNNKSVVEIVDSGSEDEEMEEESVKERTVMEKNGVNSEVDDDLEGIQLLPDETMTIDRQSVVNTPQLFENSMNDSDVIVVESSQDQTPKYVAAKEVEQQENDEQLPAEVKMEAAEKSMIGEDIQVVAEEDDVTGKDETILVANDQVDEVIEEPIDNLEVSKEMNLVLESDQSDVMEDVSATAIDVANVDQTIGESAAIEKQQELEAEVSITEESAADSSIPAMNVVVQEMYKSPMKKITSSLADIENSPVKRNSLQKTPKKGLLMGDETLPRSPLQNVSNMVGIRELFKTPKGEAEKNFVGLRELMKTPHQQQQQQTVMFATADIVGLKEMMKTPGRLFNNDVNMVGVKELLKTPKVKEEANLVGLKEMVNTPAQQKEVRLLGVRELMQTPKAASEEVRMLGVKELLNTPAGPSNVNTVGVKELFNTPQVARDVNMVGVKELMKTPAVGGGVCAVAEGMAEIFKTPAPIRRPKRILESEEEEEEMKETVEDVQEQQEVIQDPEETIQPDEVADVPENIVQEAEKIQEQEEIMQQEVDPEIVQSLETVVPLDEAEKEILSENIPIPSETVDQLPEEQSPEAIEQQNSPEMDETQAPPALDTSAELFDKMMNRKSIKHTYARQTPRKDGEDAEGVAEEKITPEKKVEVERWVESIIVTGSGQVSVSSKKPVNNNLQILSDRYSNVTPSQAQKAESVLMKTVVEEKEPDPSSKVEVTEVAVTIQVQEEETEEQKEVNPVETEEPKEATVTESEPTIAPVAEVEEEKPKRGRRPIVRAVAIDEAETPKTPLRTRRNLRTDLEDTPSAVSSPRTRRAASVKLEEAEREVKTTPAGRRGRKANPVVEELKKSEGEKGEEKVATPTAKRGRKPAAAKTVEVVEEVEKEIQEEKPVEVDEVKISETPAKKTETPLKRIGTPLKKTETPVKRRGRQPKAVASQTTVDEKKEEDEVKEREAVEEKPEASPKKPAGRGRGRRAATVEKVERSESEQTTTEAEDVVPVKAPVARGRKKKVIAVVEEEQETEKLSPESHVSSVEKEIQEEEKKVESTTEEETVKPKPGRGRKAQRQVTTTDTDESPKEEVEVKPKRGRGAVKKTASTAKRTVTEDVESPEDDEKSSSPKKTKLADENEKELDVEEESVPMKKPTRGRKAAIVQQEANDSVVSTPGKRGRGRKAATVEKGESITEAVSAPAPTRGRPKRVIAVAQSASVEMPITPKRMKKHVSEDTEEEQKTNDTDEEQKKVVEEGGKKPKRGRAAAAPKKTAALKRKEESQEEDGEGKSELEKASPAKKSKIADESVKEVDVEEQKPKRRGRVPKKEKTVDVVEEVPVATSAKTTGRGRKAKVVVVKPEEESVESEKESTADESTTSTATRGKKVAAKRKAPAATASVDESATMTDHETSNRPRRATRRRN